MPTKVAYIVSMKRGLPAFTFKEIKELICLGVDVYCYVMRSGKGPYMPELGWKVVDLRMLEFTVTLMLFLLRRPKEFIQTFISAIRDKGVVHFLIAIYFTKYLLRQSIDVIYSFEGLHALWIGYYCRFFTHIPLTVIGHAEMIDTRQKVGLTSKAINACYRIITISNYNKAKIIKQFHVPDEKIEVVRLFADFEEDKSVKVLIVGEWSERKGHETLLKAVQEPGMEDFKVWIVGGGAWGTEYFDVEEYVQEHNLGDRVVIWGKVSEELLKLLYENCDIFCLPSRTTRKGVQEGIPVALMEAMFFSKPVISTYHTGIPELVSEILIHENDYKALSKALIKLRSAELREKLGSTNKQIIEKKYNIRNVKKIAKILKEGIMEKR
jgi:glycosyltransferase involved in cell wall biosynthesis